MLDGFREKFASHRSGASRGAMFSYVFDYVIIFVLLGAFLALDFIKPFNQEFSLENYTLHYKYAVHERVPNMALVVIAVACPVVIVALYTLGIDGIFSHKVGGRSRKYTWTERLWELNCGILGLGLSISLQYVIVGSLKNAIGKPRPDLIDRCQPPAGTVDPPFGLSNSTICTQQNEYMMKDAFRSFPSGHSSTAFAGLFYISLYLSGKLHVLDSRGEVWKMFVVLAPSLGAALVAGSRIMDARHHPFDVLSGSLIGILIAWAAYRQYFPALSDFRAKGRAFPIRTWGKDKQALKAEDRDAYHQEAALDPEAAAAEYASSRSSPDNHVPASGNYFRDEIRASQRQRRTPSRRGGPAGQPLRSRGDTPWEELPEEDARDEYELQPQYTLSNPNPQGQGFYDPYPASTTPQVTTAYQPQTVQQKVEPQTQAGAAPLGIPPRRPVDTASEPVPEDDKKQQPGVAP